MKAQPLVGIDIGSSKITTLIALRSEETQSINVVGVASLPSAGVKKSQIVDIDEAIKSITASVEAAERMAGLSISKAFINIGGSQIASKNSTGVVAVSEPEGEITDSDVKRVIDSARAVSLPAAQEVLHVLPRQYKVDSQEGIKDPVNMNGVRLEAEAHLVLGSTTSIRNLTKCVTELGIGVEGLVYSGLAASESVLTATEKELGVVLVDLGGGTTSIAIWVDGSLAHSAVLPIGAKNITNDLAIGMRLGLDVAEEVKKHLGDKIKPHTAGEEKQDEDSKDGDLDLSKFGAEEHVKTSRKTLVEGIIRPRLQEIFSMIGESIKESGFGGRTPAGIVLTGGGSKTVEIDSICKRVLSMPVRLGSPHTLNGLVDDVRREPAFAVSEGLILYASKSNVTSSRVSGGNSFVRGITDKLPKGMFGRAIEFIKQFLP